MYFRTKEEVPLFKLTHAEAELKLLKQRVAVIEKEINPEILEARGHEERSAFYKQHEISEGEKLIF